MKTGIYEIVNSVDGKRYIGSAANFRARFSSHLTRLRQGVHHSRKLQNAWNKHGSEVFEFRRLLLCLPSDLLMYEQIAMDALLPEYNVAPKAGSCIGMKWSDEAKARISSRPNDHMKGRKHSPETIALMSAARMGNTATKGKARNRKAVAASASAHVGMKRSPETCAKIAAKATGRIWTDEAKAKLSATLTGRKMSDEARSKLVGNQRASGRKQTPEERANRAEKMRAAWAAKKAAGLPWRPSR